MSWSSIVRFRASGSSLSGMKWREEGIATSYDMLEVQEDELLEFRLQMVEDINVREVEWWSEDWR